MGDKEFEDFLDGSEGSESHGIQACQKDVMLGVIGTRMEFVSNMFASTVDFLSSANTSELLKVSKESVAKAEVFMTDLITQSNTCLKELDYLLSRILDEIDPDDEDEDEEK